MAFTISREAKVKAARLHEDRAANSRRELNCYCYARKRGSATCLTARGRRMLENACAKKRRFYPLRSQCRNFRKLNNRNRCTDQRRMRYMIVAAGGDHRHSAAVLGTIRVRVDTLVQLRRSTQRECPEKCDGNASRYQWTPAIC